jgi:hypothetical protein
MIKKVSRYTLQQIFIESLEDCESFKIIDGLNPFHIMLNGKELYIYIKNLSPAYFTNPDVWRIQLPRKEEFESIKKGVIDFVLLGYDADNDVYTTWHPKWAKQRLNNGESVSFYSRLSLQKEAASTEDIKRLSLNNDGEVIAFPREHLEFLLSNLKTFFQDDSDYVAMGSKRRPEANEAYKTFCDVKNIDILARSMADDGYSNVTIGNYCRALKALINDGYISRNRKIFLSCDNLSEYADIVSEFCSQPDVKAQNEKWHNLISAALRAYINCLIKVQRQEQSIAVIGDSDYWNIIRKKDIYDDFRGYLLIKGYNPTTVNHYIKAIRTLRDSCWLDCYKSFFDNCLTIDDLRNAFEEFFSIPEIDTFNQNKHRDLSAMTKQLVEYIRTQNENSSDQLNDSVTQPNISNGEYPVANDEPANIVSDVNGIDTDWETMFTDADGKLTKIANPALIDKLRPHLDSEYVSPVSAYSEVEDFYGERYSNMDMGEWMKLFKAIDWTSPYVKTYTKAVSTTTEKKKSKAEILRVEYPDGKVVQYPKAIDTFIEVVENNYPDLIHELNILHANVNLVTKEPSEQYSFAQREIADGWLVFTNINTRKKREDLIKISNELELGLKVDVVSLATGEIVDIDDKPSSLTRQKIKVIFPDGKTIQPNKVLEALVEVVKYAGPERVHDLGIIVCADNLVLKTPKPRYVKPCKPVGDGWFVNTCSDTPTKYEQIKQISSDLELNLQVTMIYGDEKQTSYINESTVDSIHSNIVCDSLAIYEVEDNTCKLTVDDVCKWVANLRTFKINGVNSPHKPVYILSIIKLISEGRIVDGRIYLNSTLIDTFKEIWNTVVPTPNPFTVDICNPYIHMASEPFYELKMKRKDISYLEIKKSLNAIREAIDYAVIDSRIVKILENKDNRSVIYKHICNFYNLRYESK